MAKLHAQLELTRCPHCHIDHPNLILNNKVTTHDHAGRNQRFWGIYRCQRCGGLVTAASNVSESGQITELYPQVLALQDELPPRAKAYLQQAIDSRHAPAGAVILAASAVDAMLKAKSYSKGTLYARIDKAKEDHIITDGMALWAHQIRLDANDQRHSDEDAELPDEKDAKRSIDFAVALGQFLFALPARVERGIAEAKSK